MEVALYVRVSTQHQQQSQTIEQQLERLRAAVAGQPNWHLAEEHIYRDDGYSGAKLSRPGLDRLRDQAALAAFELVLITTPDRSTGRRCGNWSDLGSTWSTGWPRAETGMAVGSTQAPARAPAGCGTFRGGDPCLNQPPVAN